MEQKNKPEEQPKELPKKVIEAPKLVEEPKSLLEQVEELKKFKDELTKFTGNDLPKKSFKLPSKVKRQSKRLKKMMEKSKFQVLLLTLGGGIIPTIAELSMGRIIVGDKYYNGVGVNTWQWMGKVPTFIIAEWDLQPITKEVLMQTTEELKTHIDPQTITIRAIEAKEAQDKAKGTFNWKGFLIIIGILAVGYFVLFRGG